MGTDLVFAMRANWTRRWHVLLQVEESIRDWISALPESERETANTLNIEWLPGADVRVPAGVLPDFRFYVTDQLEMALSWLTISNPPEEVRYLRSVEKACLWLLGLLDEHEGTHSVGRDGYVEVTKATR